MALSRSSSRLSMNRSPRGSYPRTLLVRSGLERELAAKMRRATPGKKDCVSIESSSARDTCFGSSVATAPLRFRILPTAMAISFWVISSLVRK